MVYPNYKLIGVPATLGELCQALDKAIELVGTEARWSGYFNHEIHIHPINACEQHYSIEPPNCNHQDDSPAEILRTTAAALSRHNPGDLKTAAMLAKRRPDNLPQEYIAPCSSLGKMLALIFMQVFNLDRIGLRDNFLSLGLEIDAHWLSARVMDFIAMIHEDLGVTLQVREFFDSPTIEQLGKRIDGPSVNRAKDTAIYPEYKLMGIPVSIGDLRQTLNNAIEFVSTQASWSGYRNRGIYIRPIDSSKQRYSIEPPKSNHERNQAAEVLLNSKKPLNRRPKGLNEYIPPRTSMEESLSQLFIQVFNIDRVGMRDIFSSLGLEIDPVWASGRVMYFLSVVHHELRITLPVHIFLESPTIEQLAKRLEDLKI